MVDFLNSWRSIQAIISHDFVLRSAGSTYPQFCGRRDQKTSIISIGLIKQKEGENIRQEACPLSSHGLNSCRDRPEPAICSRWISLPRTDKATWSTTIAAVYKIIGGGGLLAMFAYGLLTTTSSRRISLWGIEFGFLGAHLLTPIMKTKGYAWTPLL